MAKFQSKYYLFFTLSLIFFCILFLTLPLEYALNFASDDSFFYLKISKNFSEGLGLTFDGVEKTSGFHPLYLIVTILIYSAAKIFSVTSSEVLFRITCIMHVIIIHAIGFFAYRLFREQENGKIRFAVFLLAGAAFVFIRDFGLESHIACLIFLLIYYNKSREQNGKNVFLNAGLISLLFLARTDYLWSLIPFIIIAEYITAGSDIRITSLRYNISAVIITAAAYYAFNYFYFGNPLPVTMTVLSSFPATVIGTNLSDLSGNTGFIFNQTARLIIFVAGIGLMFISYFISTKKTGILFVYAAFGLLLNLTIHLFFNRYNIREWYLTLPLFAVIMFAVFTYDFKIKFANYTIIIILAVTLAGLLYFTRLSDSKWKYQYEYAQKLNKEVKANECVYQFDYSGLVSFFSDRRIINGDGFAAGREYSGFLMSNRIPDYFRFRKIDYVSTIITDSMRYGEDGNFIFQNEPFLNPLKRKPETIKLVSDFGFKSAARNAKGYFVLINTDDL